MRRPAAPDTPPTHPLRATAMAALETAPLFGFAPLRYACRRYATLRGDSPLLIAAGAARDSVEKIKLNKGKARHSRAPPPNLRDLEILISPEPIGAEIFDFSRELYDREPVNFSSCSSRKFLELHYNSPTFFFVRDLLFRVKFVVHLPT